MPNINIAVVGATGVIGGALIDALGAAALTEGELRAVASTASVNETVMYNKRTVAVEALESFDFSQVALVFFAVPAPVSGSYAPAALAAGCQVIDLSGCYRADAAIPLVVYGVNDGILLADNSSDIVALPDSLATDLSWVLKPVHDEVEITRVSVATYQGVSSAGRAGVGELAAQSASLLSGVTTEPEVFGRQVAFNVIPQVGEMSDSQHSRAEIGLINEVRRVLGDRTLQMSATCVQVPVFYGYCQAVNFETRYPVEAEQVVRWLKGAAGLTVFPVNNTHPYPVPVDGANAENGCSVGRIRNSIGVENGIDLWIASDNVQKSAIINAIHTAKLLLKDSL